MKNNRAFMFSAVLVSCQLFYGSALGAVAYFSSDTQWATSYSTTTFTTGADAYPTLNTFTVSADFVVKPSPTNWAEEADNQNSYLVGPLGIMSNRTPDGITTLTQLNNTIVIGSVGNNGIELMPNAWYYFGSWRTQKIAVLGLWIETTSSDWVVKINSEIYPVTSGFMGWISENGQIGKYSSIEHSRVEIFNTSSTTASDTLNITTLQYGLIPEPSTILFSILAGGTMLIRRKRCI